MYIYICIFICMFSLYFHMYMYMHIFMNVCIYIMHIYIYIYIACVYVHVYNIYMMYMCVRAGDTVSQGLSQLILTILALRAWRVRTPTAAMAADGGVPSVVLGVGILCIWALRAPGKAWG